jgi:hypothetical protein
MTPLDQVLGFLGKVVLFGGGVVSMAFVVFRYLGKSWIDAQFSQGLEAFKHEQAKEIQRMKITVDSMLSGALKIQEREFTVLPEAWHKLNEAYSLTGWVVSPFQQYPDVGRMAEDELTEYLATSDLRESQRTRVRNARDRNQTYQDAIFWHRLLRAKTAVGELGNYTLSHGLFLPRPLKQKFSEMRPILWSSLTALEVGHETKDFQMQSKAWTDLQQQGEPLHKAIEEAIEQRLHSHASPLAEA